MKRNKKLEIERRREERNLPRKSRERRGGLQVLWVRLKQRIEGGVLISGEFSASMLSIVKVATKSKTLFPLPPFSFFFFFKKKKFQIDIILFWVFSINLMQAIQSNHILS